METLFQKLSSVFLKAGWFDLSPSLKHNVLTHVQSRIKVIVTKSLWNH